MLRLFNIIKSHVAKIPCRVFGLTQTQNWKHPTKLALQSTNNWKCSKNTRAFHINKFPSHDDLSTLHWGIAPVSLMADDFATALSVLPNNEHTIASCVAMSQAQALAFAEKHHVQNIYASFEELARCPKVDVVYISPLNPLHCELCHLMLNHDKHVLCEKPLCMTESQVMELLNKARAKNLFLMEGMWPRCVPAYHYLRRQIVRDELGEVFNVRCTLGLPISKSKLALYGGVCNDFGVYALQLVLWIYREVPEKIKTSGVVNEDGVDVAANIELIFPRGRRALISLDSEKKLPNEAVIRGSKGKIKMTNYWCPTRMRDSANNELVFPLPETHQSTNYHNRIAMCYEAEEVRNCLLSGRTESDLFNHNESLLIANLIDKIHELLGMEKTAAVVELKDRMQATVGSN